MTSAFRWAAMRAILLFHKCEGQSHKTVSTDHNFWRKRRAEADSNWGPSAYKPNALLLGQTGSHQAKKTVSSFIWTTKNICFMKKILPLILFMKHDEIKCEWWADASIQLDPKPKVYKVSVTSILNQGWNEMQNLVPSQSTGDTALQSRAGVCPRVAEQSRLSFSSWFINRRRYQACVDASGVHDQKVPGLWWCQWCTWSD